MTFKTRKATSWGYTWKEKRYKPQKSREKGRGDNTGVVTVQRRKINKKNNNNKEESINLFYLPKNAQ